jgi:hypothetical protein
VSVTLINTTRRMKVINLPHASYCEARGSCACQTRGAQRLAAAITLPAQGSATGLDDAVLGVPAVARAVRVGELRVQQEAKAGEPPAPTDPTPKTRSRKATRRTGRKKAR